MSSGSIATDDLYHESLLAEARSPKNQGVLTNPTLEGVQTNASCGDTVRVMILLDSTGTLIEDIKWQGSGCIISQASLSVVSSLIKGKSLEIVRDFSPTTLLTHLGLESITPGRRKCLLLGLKTIQKLLKK